jgi:hypothetical protein
VTDLDGLPIRLRAPNSSPAPNSSGGVTIAALGDLMLAGEWDDISSFGAMEESLGALGELVQADVVFANLEATVPGDGEAIAKQPRLIGQRATLEAALKCLRLNLASLANNHTFDALLGGFSEVRGLLDDLGITYLGAGQDLEEASQPVILERGGLTFGWLAFTDHETRPSHVASSDSYGVNPLEQDEAEDQIAELAKQVDHVIVSLHWGVEYCHLPAPTQITVARRLIDAGASLVIGHHAHVIQGVEAYGGGAIAYNLGNAATTDLKIDGRLAIHQNVRTRSSFALRATFTSEGLKDVELVPFYAGRGGIELEHQAPRRILERANRSLAAGVSESQWKRVRLFEDVVMRTVKKLHPRVIRSVRPRHFAKLFSNIVGAVSGRGPAA